MGDSFKWKKQEQIDPSGSYRLKWVLLAMESPFFKILGPKSITTGTLCNLNVWCSYPFCEFVSA